MKLLVYSWFPVYADHMIGGAQQVMHDFLTGLSENGINTTVICPQVKDKTKELLTINHINVMPVLKEFSNRPLYPYEQLSNFQWIRKLSKPVDVIWSLDFTFPIDLPQPIVLSLDNFTYKEEMESFWDFNWDTLILPSKYLFNIAKSILDPMHKDKNQNIKIVPYAVDYKHFIHTEPLGLCKKLGIQYDDSYILFPHRPDPDKGFDIVLNLIAALAANGNPHKLLIPMNNTYKADKKYYDYLKDKASGLSIYEQVIFTNWIDIQDLPAFYSLGCWTLAIGTFPEGFGLTPLQSICCGTPAICTKAGGLMDHLPSGHGLFYVDFFNIDQIREIIERGVSTSEIAQGQHYIKEHYSTDRFVQEHIECLRNVKKRKRDIFYCEDNNPIRISPWCHMFNDGGIWHDYYMRYVKISRKEKGIIEKISQGCKEYSGTEIDTIKMLLRKGIIIGEIDE